MKYKKAFKYITHWTFNYKKTHITKRLTDQLTRWARKRDNHGVYAKQKKRGGVRTEGGVMDQPLTIEPLCSHYWYQNFKLSGWARWEKKKWKRQELIIDACEHEPDLTLFFFFLLGYEVQFNMLVGRGGLMRSYPFPLSPFPFSSFLFSRLSACTIHIT